mgnify:CR=1 FL=1
MEGVVREGSWCDLAGGRESTQPAKSKGICRGQARRNTTAEVRQIAPAYSGLIRGDLLVSQCCCNKPPHIEWLKTMNVFISKFCWSEISARDLF